MTATPETLEPSQDSATVSRESSLVQRKAVLKATMEKLEETRAKILALEECEESRKEKQLRFLHLSIQQIRTDDIDCTDANCRCKPLEVFTTRALRLPAPVAEILTHQIFKNEIHLLCRLDSPKSIPEYRKQCQVDKSVRAAYRARLLTMQKVPDQSEVWTAEQESAFRDSIHPQLNHKQALIQKQVQQCRDTVEWYTCTKNGKAMTKIPTDTKKAPPLGPATFTTGGEALYHVERVLGATVNQGKIWVLVKWLGYKSSDNSWEPITALQGCSAEIKEFYKKFSKPTWKNPKIMSPEGLEHEEWLEKWEKVQEIHPSKEKTQPPAASASVDEGKPSVSVPVAEEKPRAATPSAEPPAATPSVERRGRKRRSVAPVEVPIKRPTIGPVLYELERVIGAKLVRGKLELLVKWKEYDLVDASWEPESGLGGCVASVERFLGTYGTPTVKEPKILDGEGKRFEELSEV